MFLLFAIACSTPNPQPADAPPSEMKTVAGPSAPSDAAAAAQRGTLAIATLGSTLKAKLVATLEAEGPVAAVEVCQHDAPLLAAKAAEDSGVRLGRSSTRLRNPKNAANPWVAQWLAAQEGRPAAEVQPSVEVVDGVVHMVMPIPVEAPCLVCHGLDDEIPPEVKAVLAERYPDDQARGYALDDLRGAFWAEVPL